LGGTNSDRRGVLDVDPLGQHIAPEPEVEELVAPHLWQIRGGIITCDALTLRLGETQ